MFVAVFVFSFIFQAGCGFYPHPLPLYDFDVCPVIFIVSSPFGAVCLFYCVLTGSLLACSLILIQSVSRFERVFTLLRFEAQLVVDDLIAFPLGESKERAASMKPCVVFHSAQLCGCVVFVLVVALSYDGSVPKAC